MFVKSFAGKYAGEDRTIIYFTKEEEKLELGIKRFGFDEPYEINESREDSRYVSDEEWEEILKDRNSVFIDIDNKRFLYRNIKKTFHLNVSFMHKAEEKKIVDANNNALAISTVLSKLSSKERENVIDVKVTYIGDIY